MVYISAGEIVEKDQSNPMSSVGVDRDNLRASKKMKKESNGPVMKLQPLDFEISKSSPANVTLKDMQKRSGISPGMGKYGSSSENSGLPDSSIKKRKLKRRQSNQHDHDPGHSNADINVKQNIVGTSVVKKNPCQN